MVDDNDHDYSTKKGEASDIKTFLHEIRTKSLIYYAIFIVLVISLTIFFLYSVKIATDNLQSLVNNGKVFLDPLSYDITMLIAIKEKNLDKEYYYSHVYPSMENTILEFINSPKDLHIEVLDYATYDDTFIVIFNKNPCELLK